MDGSCKVAKVLEIGPDYITIVPLSESGAPFVDANELVQKNAVLLIEYKNGSVEIYNKPGQTAVFNPDGEQNKLIKKDKEDITFYNFASINTLALCNSDISGFFERLSQTRGAGLGLIASYNFNRFVTAPNSFLLILNNAKKNYDIGAFVNFYPTHFKRRSNFTFGLMFKYTSFNFDRLVEEKNGNTTIVKYIPSKGNQLATIVTIGAHRYLTKNIFIKTIAGIGGFKLKGDYKQQFNYFINKDNKPGDPVYNYNFLPKIYLGLNLGFDF